MTLFTSSTPLHKDGSSLRQTKVTFASCIVSPATAVTVPHLLTPREVAVVLRTSPQAIYAMVERLQLPGVVRIGRRVLIREDALVDWLGQKSTPSLERSM